MTTITVSASNTYDVAIGAGLLSTAGTALKTLTGSRSCRVCILSDDNVFPLYGKTVSDALEARELIKMRVLENSGEDVRDAAEQLAAATDSEVVAVIGKCLILYRESTTKKKIELC